MQQETHFKKELIKLRKTKRENEMQVLRKGIECSSRLLDNYYNPELHPKTWKPNGQVISRKKYNHGETGLSHFFERQNVLQKLDLEEKIKQTKKQVKFLEFEYLENDEIIITIEHCSNCEEHQTHTQHTNEIYRNIAKLIQKCVLLKYPFIKVYLKPIETEIINREAEHKINTFIIDNHYKEVRIGAMEIQLATRKENQAEAEVHLLHSKLTSGQWPSIGNILTKIASLMPRLNVKCVVFDKDQGFDKDQVDVDELLPTIYENVKVNLYSFNHPQIEEFSTMAAEELENVFNPHKRKILIHQARQLEKESYQKSTSLEPLTQRPYTGRSTYTAKNISLASRITSPRQNLSVNLTSRPLSSSSGFLIYNRHLNSLETIEDKEMIQKLKGKLVMSGYTDKSGITAFMNIPYDAYLIEVEDSKNFLTCGGVLRFQKIISKVIGEEKKEVKENGKREASKEVQLVTLTKIFGLRRQIEGYVEIFIYFNIGQDTEEYNLQLISGCEVILKRCADNVLDSGFFDASENKLIVKENKLIKGRHEIITAPGHYLLEVSKSGYDRVKKEIELKSGENKINVQLTQERKYKINVIVYQYQSKTVLEHTKLKISYSRTDTIIDGLTDSSGTFSFDTVKNDDFLTVYATKEGYFPVQRTFIKEFPESKVKYGKEEKEITTVDKVKGSIDILKDVVIFLVRESFIIDQRIILIIAYSNSFEENYEFVLDKSNKIGHLIETNIENSQHDKGVLSCEIVKNENFDEFDFESKGDEFDEIVRLSLMIKNPMLLKHYEIDHRTRINGLFKYSCEICLYTHNNIFFIQSPQFSQEASYSYWDIGFLDIKSDLFYETGLLMQNSFVSKNVHFDEWLGFLQILIDLKLYAKIFEAFQFNKGILSQNDRMMYDSAFIRSVKSLPGVCNANQECAFSTDFLIYLCDIVKNNYKMISFALLKKKIMSNLKNFRAIGASILNK